MSFDRSFMNWEEGFGMCCWNAPSREELEAVFKKAGTPYERMISIEEHVAETLTT